MSEEHIHKNLVFEGGGTLIVLYAGAARTLEEHGILARVERTAGASTGAVMAMLVALRLSADGIKATLDDLDWSKIPQKHDHGPLSKWSIRDGWDKLTAGNAESVQRLFSKYGFYSNNYFHGWLESVVESATGNGRATFADLRAAGHPELHVIGSNVSTHASEVFCAERTPDVAVADAVRISTAIPLYFEAMQFNGTEFDKGDYYTDGGFTDNYPLWLFDQSEYGEGNPYYIGEINWETLGFYHFTPPDGSDGKGVHNLLSFIENLVATVARAKDLSLHNSEVMRQRTVLMSDCRVSQTDFAMKSTDERYAQLFETGREATAAFLKAFTPPSG